MKTNLFLSGVVALGVFSIASAQDKAVSKTGKLITVNAEATTAAKGIIKLAGDLGGTADAPVIVPDAITSDKILNGAVTTGKIADGNVTTTKIAAGQANQFLKTDANGTVVWATVKDVLKTTQVFTATSLQTEFTLDHTPIDSESVFAFRNGVSIGNFTLNDKVITISANDIEADDIITFKYSY